MSSPRAVIYVRDSSPDQVNNTSLETQELACRDYCERSGIDVAQVFREEGASAKTTARPELQRMLSYCTANSKSLDYSVVWKVDRLSRRVADHQTIRMSLAHLGIRLRAVEETFDESAAGQLVENMMAAIAQFDNDVRSDRTKRGMLHALQNGRWVWGAPIGYLRSPKESKAPSLVPDPETAHLIRFSFQQLGDGNRSKADVLREVTSLGLSRNGRPLTPQSFNNLLRNPLYMGWIVSKGLDWEGPGDFEPLIDRAVFEAVQNRAPDRAGSPRHTKQHPDFPLRGFLQCNRCLSPLTGSWSTGRSAKYGYYRCFRQSCGIVKGRREAVHRQFEDQLRQLDASPNLSAALLEVVRDAWKERQADKDDRSEVIQRRIEKLRLRKRQLFDAHVYEGTIDEVTFSNENEQIDGDIAALHDRLPSQEWSNEVLHSALGIAEQMLTDLPDTWNRLQPQEVQVFLRAVFPGGLTYGDDAFGTARTGWLFYETSLPDTVEEALVAPMGFEPTLPP